MENESKRSSRETPKKKGRSLSSKLAEGGESRRKARREFFTERSGQGSHARRGDYDRRGKKDERRDRVSRTEGSESRGRYKSGERREFFENSERTFYSENRNDRRKRSFRDDRDSREWGGESFGNRKSRFESRRRDDRRYSNDKREPHYIENSKVIDEIVKRRREEGRMGERRPKVLSLEWNENRGLIRLNKYIANAGVCSRREADKLIEAGAVTVNGVVVTELGTKVMPTDEVRYGDQVLQKEKPVYILLNKPKDFITTTNDEYDRKSVMNLITGACEQRVYPVGRLDRNTTGLLLITNDGEMAKKLTHPRYGVKKIYHVELDKNLSQTDFEQIITGVELNDGFIAPDELAYVGESKREIGIALHSGKNRIVRRIFEFLGYEIVKLDRVYYAGLTKKDLPRGHWRFLRNEEINILKMSL